MFYNELIEKANNNRKNAVSILNMINVSSTSYGNLEKFVDNIIEAAKCEVMAELFERVAHIPSNENS